MQSEGGKNTVVDVDKESVEEDNFLVGNDDEEDEEVKRSIAAVVVVALVLFTAVTGCGTSNGTVENAKENKGTFLENVLGKDDRRVNRIEIRARYSRNYDTGLAVLEGTETKEYGGDGGILRTMYLKANGEISDMTEVTELKNGRITAVKRFTGTGECVEETTSEYDRDTCRKTTVIRNFGYKEVDVYEYNKDGTVTRREHSDEEKTRVEIYGKDGLIERLTVTKADGVVEKDEEYSYDVVEVEEGITKEMRYANGSMVGYTVTERDSDGRVTRRTCYDGDGNLETDTYMSRNTVGAVEHMITADSFGNTQTNLSYTYDESGRMARVNGELIGRDENNRPALYLDFGQEYWLSEWSEVEYRDVDYAYNPIYVGDELPFDPEITYVDYSVENSSLVKKCTMVAADGEEFTNTYDYDLRSDGTPERMRLYDDGGEETFEVGYDEHGNEVYQRPPAGKEAELSEMSADMSSMAYEYVNEYDSEGRLTRHDTLQSYDGGNPEKVSSDRFTYDKYGRLVKADHYNIFTEEELVYSEVWLYSNQYGLIYYASMDGYDLIESVVYKGNWASLYSSMYGAVNEAGEEDLDEYGNVTKVRKRELEYKNNDQIGWGDYSEDFFEYDEHGNCTWKTEAGMEYTYDYDVPMGCQDQVKRKKVTFYRESTAEVPQTPKETGKKLVDDEERAEYVEGIVEKQHHEADPEIGGMDYDVYIFKVDKPQNYLVVDEEGYSDRAVVREAAIIASEGIDLEELVDRKISCVALFGYAYTAVGSDFTVNISEVEIIE